MGKDSNIKIINNLIKDKKKNKDKISNKKSIDNIKYDDVDSFETSINENESKLVIIFKFIKSFKISKNSNITNIQIPAALVTPKSTLSYFTDSFINNFDILLKIVNIDDSLERLLNILKYVGSILFHIPVYSKPLNPILGETQKLQFHIDMGGGTIETNNYLCIEQISHHPPKLVICIYNKSMNVKMITELNFDIYFMGTYIKVDTQGQTIIKIKDDVYTATLPFLAVRFIRGFSEFIGPFSIESNTGYKIKGKFNEKPIIGGEYDGFESSVYNISNEHTHQIIGQWSKNAKLVNLKTKETNQNFYNRLESPRYVKIIEETLDTNSNNVWKGVIDAHNQGNNKIKSIEKRKVEQQQRQLENQRILENVKWVPKHFIQDHNNNWDLLNY